MLLVSKRTSTRWRFPAGRISKSKNCRQLGCLRHFRRRFLGSRAVLLKAYHFAGLSITSSIRTPFWAWVGSLPPLQCWRGAFRGVTTFIHESNAVPGKANRWTARLVNAVMLGFKECAPFFPKTHTEITGTATRTELVPLDRADSRRKLGLREDLSTLLVMGGSQGASGINQALIKALPFLQRSAAFQVIHLSGTRDERLVADNYRRENVPAYIGAFHHQMEEVSTPRTLSLRERERPALPSSLPFRYPAS